MHSVSSSTFSSSHICVLMISVDTAFIMNSQTDKRIDRGQNTENMKMACCEYQGNHFTQLIPATSNAS